MPYDIADKEFQTKNAIRDRCREILSSTPDGSSVSDDQLPFLLELFQFHDEWDQKKADGVRRISTQTTDHGTRCFVLVRSDDSQIDISFPHAISLIPTARSKDRIPQQLKDFRSAARVVIRDQIYAFRDKTLATKPTCPILGGNLTRDNCHVDHQGPLFFDRLLFEYCVANSINPLATTVQSVNGTTATFADDELARNWSDYHQSNCQLRLISKLANLQSKPPKVDWAIVLNP